MAEYIKVEDATPYLTKYVPSVEAVERSKVDKAIEEIEGEYSTCNQDWIDGINWALDILKRNIGE